MNRQLSLAAIAVVLFAATANLTAHAQWSIEVPGLTMQPEICRVEGRYAHPNWLVEFCSVPRLLRMHVPALPAEQGVLINRIAPNGPAALCYDLHVGDILLTADGEPVFGMASLPESPGTELTVLRGGEEISVEARAVCPPQPLADLRPQSLPLAAPQGNPYGASVSAFSSANESVSVSQNGDQITLEMSLPTLQSAPIRFRGTRQQITRDVEASKLSPAARQRVLQAIR